MTREGERCQTCGWAVDAVAEVDLRTLPTGTRVRAVECPSCRRPRPAFDGAEDTSSFVPPEPTTDPAQAAEVEAAYLFDAARECVCQPICAITSGKAHYCPFGPSPDCTTLARVLARPSATAEDVELVRRFFLEDCGANFDVPTHDCETCTLVKEDCRDEANAALARVLGTPTDNEKG